MSAGWLPVNWRSVFAEVEVRPDVEGVKGVWKRVDQSGSSKGRA